MTWNEFLQKCRVAWATEGQQESKVHSYLIRCEKQPTMNLMQIAASAWLLYKEEN